jgi:hypothetical protein
MGSRSGGLATVNYGEDPNGGSNGEDSGSRGNGLDLVSPSFKVPSILMGGG